MKFAYLTLAGIFCILGHGHGTKIQLGECTDKPGYVYCIWQSVGVNVEGYVGFIMMEKFIGSSEKTPTDKIKDLSEDLTIVSELARYPVSNCDEAIRKISTKIESMGYIKFLDDGQIMFGVERKQTMDFVYATETAIYDLFQLQDLIPPNHLIEACGHSPGYVHIVFMRFIEKSEESRFLGYCIRVFGSSNIVHNPLTMFDLIQLPHMNLDKAPHVTTFQADNCLTGTDLIHKIIKAKFMWNDGELFGEKCYATTEDINISAALSVIEKSLADDATNSIAPTEEQPPKETENHF